MARVFERADGAWLAEVDGKDVERHVCGTRQEAVEWVIGMTPFVEGPGAKYAAEDVPVYVLRNRTIQVYERGE